MCIMEKALANILNTRLTKWNTDNSIISDLQGAFQQGKGAEETILSLKLLITHSININASLCDLKDRALRAILCSWVRH